MSSEILHSVQSVEKQIRLAEMALLINYGTSRNCSSGLQQKEADVGKILHESIFYILKLFSRLLIFYREITKTFPFVLGPPCPKSAGKSFHPVIKLFRSQFYSKTAIVEGQQLGRPKARRKYCIAHVC